MYLIWEEEKLHSFSQQDLRGPLLSVCLAFLQKYQLLNWDAFVWDPFHVIWQLEGRAVSTVTKQLSTDLRQEVLEKHIIKVCQDRECYRF